LYSDVDERAKRNNVLPARSEVADARREGCGPRLRVEHIVSIETHLRSCCLFSLCGAGASAAAQALQRDAARREEQSRVAKAILECVILAPFSAFHAGSLGAEASLGSASCVRRFCPSLVSV
jgi:hypothetical protein